MTIYKYPIQVTASRQELWLPADHHILHVGLDPKDDPCIWAEVDPTSPAEQVLVDVVGTGGTVPHDYVTARRHGDQDCYRGTIVMGPYVWHVYARRSRPIPV